MGKRAEQSKKAYDNMAAAYDSTKEGLYTRAHRAELIKNVCVRDGDTLLDVGCGNGELLSALAGKAAVNAFGIDISENMVAVAKTRHPNCTFASQPATPLRFGDASIDVITVSCAFHHFEDPHRFAAECFRVLKDGGVVYMAEPYFPPLIRLLANRIVFPFSHTGDVRVYSEKELRAIFEAAGFSDMQTHSKDTVLFLKAKKRNADKGD